jgi:hypothetical protein
VGTAEVDQLIYDQVTYLIAPPTPEPITPTEQLATPTVIPQKDMDTTYEAFLNAQNLSEKEYRKIIERGLLRSSVQDALAAQVETTGLVAHVMMIQTDTAEEATAALERIQNGEEFATVAKETSTDTTAEENGGDLGWVAPGQYIARYGETWDVVVSALDLEQVEQIESNGKFYVLQVLERDENGQLPDQVISQRQSSALADWLTAQTTSPDVEIVRMLEPGMLPPDPFAAP